MKENIELSIVSGIGRGGNTRCVGNIGGQTGRSVSVASGDIAVFDNNARFFTGLSLGGRRREEPGHCEDRKEKK